MKLFQTILLLSLVDTAVEGFVPAYQPFKKSTLSSSDVGLQPVAQDGASHDDDAVAKDRRSALKSIVAVGLAGAHGPATANAAPAKKKKNAKTYFKGKITVQDGEMAALGDYKAIFISARPKNPTSIPPEVVASARGGVPAVFFAAILNPKFPAEFSMTENDITPEGDFGLTSDPYWWAEDTEWEISARVDYDGAVRTLDANDSLVGRTITAQPGEGSPDTEVCVVVKDRGSFGSY